MNISNEIKCNRMMLEIRKAKLYRNAFQRMCIAICGMRMACMFHWLSHNTAKRSSCAIFNPWECLWNSRTCNLYSHLTCWGFSIILYTSCDLSFSSSHFFQNIMYSLVFILFRFIKCKFQKNKQMARYFKWNVHEQQHQQLL